MENNERDRKLDQWLDEALSEYSAAEPRFGLEQRVLSRIRSEEQHSRKWNLWRWMPAFGALAALVIVALAVGPMLDKKTSIQQLNSRIDTPSRPAKQSPKSAGPESIPKNAESPITKPTNQPGLNDTARGAPTVREDLAIVPQKKGAPLPADRERLALSQGARIDDQLRPTRSYEKKEGGSLTGPVALAGTPAAVPPPPSPPPPQVQPSAVAEVAGGSVGGVPPMTAKAAPTSANQGDLKSNAATAEAPSNEPVLLNDKVATQSMAAVIAKGERRKEAHAKPETNPQDANTIEAFGVTVRFQTGPSTQQFPTPVPLSNQEKLALKAGPELKDTALARHKSTEITPIEIKNVEIKPLEGAEKEK